MLELQRDLRDAIAPVLQRYGAGGHVEQAVQVILDRIPMADVHPDFIGEVQTLFNADPVPT